MLLLTIAVLLNLIIAAVASSSSSSGVVVDKQRENPTGPAVSRDRRYSAHVTLYIENVDDKSKTPSGWSTRKEDGADTDSPFVFQPGVNLIQGWTDGVLQMNEGERAYLHVPPALGYGARPVGSPHGPFYVPASSHLLFDIEILGREGGGEDSAAAGADEEIEL
jgi:peptidylprolyl isomerase